MQGALRRVAAGARPSAIASAGSQAAALLGLGSRLDRAGAAECMPRLLSTQAPEGGLAQRQGEPETSREASGAPQRRGGAAAKPPPATPQPAGAAAGARQPPKRPAAGSLADLPGTPAGAYFSVPGAFSAVPEAARTPWEDPLLSEERVAQTNYGCKGVQAEFGHTEQEALLARPTLLALLDAAAAGTPQRLYLDGWAGSGKSTALFSLVAWARAAGWVVLYLPNADLLVQGGTYYQADDGLWDTPVAARQLLTVFSGVHGDALQGLRTQDGSRSLADIVKEGLGGATPSGPGLALDALVKELLAVQPGSGTKVLLAVDGYNALHWRTRYLEAVHTYHSRQLAPEELRLVHTFRLLERPAPAAGLTVGAASASGRVSRSVRVPAPKRSRLVVPRYTLAEAQAVVRHYAQQGVIAGEPSAEQVKRAYFLTNGSGAELRRWAAPLLHDDDPLGLSLGYKAAAAAKRAAHMADGP